MRQAVLISVIAVAVLLAGCQRKDLQPKPTVSMLPLARMAA